jgi:CRP/FNR family nitrogen fixation transcriptional regulator
MTPKQEAGAMSISYHTPSGGFVPGGWAERSNEDPLVEAIDAMGVLMTFAKEEEIYGQGEETDLIYRVVRGCVRTIRFMADGRRQIGGFYNPGDVFGVEPGSEHRYAAEGVSDCAVVVLKRSALRGAIERDRDVERRLWALMVGELEHAQDRLLLLGRKTACEKVASFLLEMADRANANHFDLPMGRQDMADYLGLTIETVSRMLTQLQQSNIIEIANCRTLRIRNRQALTDLSD